MGERIASFHLPLTAHAGECPSPSVRARAFLSQVMNHRSNDLIITFNIGKSIKAGVGVTSETDMSVLWGSRLRGIDLTNCLIIEVVSVSALRQVSTHDQNHTQQHVSGKAGNTSPTHVGNEVPVDGHGKREVRTIAENKVPVIRSQGIDPRCSAGVGGPMPAGEGDSRRLTCAVAADYAVSG